MHPPRSLALSPSSRFCAPSLATSHCRLSLSDLAKTRCALLCLLARDIYYSLNLALQLGALAANLIAHMAADFVNIECLDLTDTDLGDEGVAYAPISSVLLSFPSFCNAT